MDRFSAASQVRSPFFGWAGGRQTRPSALSGSVAALLRSGASHSVLALVLAVAGGTLVPAYAATYTAGTEAELRDAIAAANADGDATSTITLTGDVALSSPSTLPTIGKSLTIDVGDYALTSIGDTIFDTADGQTLTLNGDVSGTSNYPQTGTATKIGGGTTVFTGTTAYGGNFTISAGSVEYRDGATLNTPTTSKAIQVRPEADSNARLLVTGAGTVVDSALYIGGAAGSQALVEITDRGVLNSYNDPVRLSSQTGQRGQSSLVVNGEGSLLNAAGDFYAGYYGESSVSVTEGGRIMSRRVDIGGHALLKGVSSTAIVSGEGSRWDSTGAFGVFNGSLAVLDQGAVTATSVDIATGSTYVADVIVSGAGSSIATSTGNIRISSSTGQGALTVAEGGRVTVKDDGTGTITITSSSTGIGVLNIGGAEGEAARGAGLVEAATIAFGVGNSTLNFNHTDVDYSFGAAITGAGTVNQAGPGTTVLTGANTYSGTTEITGGTLRAGGAATLSAASDYTVGGSGTLDLAGFSHTLASLENGGNVRLGAAANTTLTVTNDYVGNGGTIYISTVLGADDSPTDLLHVEGSTSGTTAIRVINVGGVGAETTEDGIKIVEVDGDSATDAFALSGPAIAGAYRYDLFQNDLTGTLDDGNWYLRADGLAPTLPTYESYPAVMLGLIDLPTLQQRVGDRRPGSDDKTGGNGLWTRIEGAHARVKADSSTTDASYDSDLFQLQVGVDGQLLENASGALIGGLTAQYSHVSADVSSDLGNGSNTTEGYGIGATLTWYGQNGVYVDGQAQFAWFDTDLSADGVGKLADGNNGTGYALSVELGKELAVAPGWTVTPQAQLAYASVDFDDMTDPFGAEVSLRKGESLKGRVGAALGRDATWQDAEGRKARSHVYGITNLTYEFLDGATVAVSGVDLVAEPQKFGAEFGLGGTYNWSDERFALHGEALASTSFDGSYGYKGTVGLTVGF